VTDAVAILGYAVRPRVLARYGGQLSLMLAALTVVPLLGSLAWGQTGVTLCYLGIISVLGLFAGLASRVDAPPQLRVNEAVVLTTLAFCGSSLLMALPMMAAGLSFMDALFESISGATTTGLSTVAPIEGRPRSWLLSRAWMQWVGGLGIVVFSVALLARSGITARSLAGADANEDDLAGSTRSGARRILVGYALLTAGGIVLLWLLGAGAFNALVYSLAAVSTGGFAPHDDSLAGLGGAWLGLMVTVICLLGAVALPFLNRTVSPAGRRLAWLQLYAVMIAGLVLALVLLPALLARELGTWRSICGALALAYSAQSTAGFSPCELGTLPPLQKLALVVSMLVGGGIGTTAGGIKIVRLLVLARLAVWMVARTCMPRHAVFTPELGGRPLESVDLRDAAIISGLYLAVVVVSWAAFLPFGYDPLDALFEVSSAVGTVGLSVGITSGELPWALKAVLCVDMLLGRLEVVAWLVLLYPRTWIGRREET
jgi:trk/ktr system potassium uptake protein